MSRPGGFDRLREDITFKTSPFVAGLKTDFISFGLMSFPLQEILVDVASYTFGMVARRVAATFVKNVLKPLATSLLSLVIVEFILEDFGLCSQGFLLGRHFLIAFHNF